MYFLYNFLLITILIATSPFWVYKVFTKEKHRKGFIEKTGILPQHIKQAPSSGKRIHIHAVSVGEVNAVTPFIKELKKRHPDIRLILSTVTPTGYDVAHKRLPEVDHIIYFPFDLPWIVKRVINTIRPHIFILVETELWPNFLRQIRRAGAVSIIINGRISPHTLRGYTFIRPFMKRVLKNVDLFCMQSDEDARRIKSIGAPDNAIKITGNMKYDQKFIDVSGKDLMEKKGVFGIDKDDLVIIAGSTHKGEEEMILESYKKCHTPPPLNPLPQGEERLEGIPSIPPPLMGGGEGEGEQKVFSSEKIRLIIAPRHIERAGEIERLVKMQGLEVVRRTELNSSKMNTIPYNTVMIVDTIGELATLYSMADVVIIGGSFIPHGGQNPLEAIYYKRPVIFGQHMFNFQEITEEILVNGAGVSVDNREDLARVLIELLNDPDMRKKMGEKGYQIIQKNRGTVEKNLVIVEKYL